ncbi:hypothetical protein SASPL_118870 [Salvia splendens]|uniref:COPA/B TPR domain-containing protein n=1 Tax=Salvia splendens TaxID=180675 RepID=A0A8X8XY41_SALSN|nr:hypothetical protein SASPL_118870 [Salvia splendens]
MPLRLEIKRKLAQRSERVKSVDLHPTEPWILASLYSGTLCIWDYQTQTMVKSFEVTEQPVRSAKFIARKQWVVAGSDDMHIHVYNYNTMDKVKVFEAHTDYIRCVAVHPTLPYVLSSSDDMLIKLWDWERGWLCTQIFEGHSHYVMQVTFNPKDTNTFASASLDRTIKIWNLGSPDPNFTLDAHLKGVNCVDYFTGGDKPYLITGSDDHTAKVWDYQTKSCVQTLEGHTHNVSAVCFHPELPIIITGSEDGAVRIWHSTTYRLENTLNYGFERVWAVSYMRGSRRVVIGYDEGTIMVKLGREVPVASMDNSGKIIWSKHNEIQTVNIKSIGADYDVADGERLPLAVKELGTCDLYPQSLKHNPNGRFVVVCGDDENADFFDIMGFICCVAHFLESRGMIEDALEVATDADYRFELAIQLGKLEIAKEIATEAQSESKWKQLGELAMSTGKLGMAEECLKQANDLSGLLLLYSSLGNAEGICELVSLAKENGKNNVAFLCLFMLGKLEDCLQLLIESNRIPEAALMARSYLPSKVSEIVALWRKDLNKINQKAAESFADPEEYPNMFEDWQVALAVEAKAAETRGKFPPAAEYMQHADRSIASLVEIFRNMQIEDEHLENGGLDYEDGEPNGDSLQEPDDTQLEGHDGSQEEAGVVDADSTDSAVLVNGNEVEEDGGSSNEENPLPN